MTDEPRSSIFVCAPEFPIPWVFYPAWLCVPGVVPSTLVMDWSDYERATDAAHASDATPYDALAWETLTTYRDYGFLRIEERLGGRVWHLSPVTYRTLVPPDRVRELGRTAEGIVARTPRPRRRALWAEAVEAWRSFARGLERGLGARAPLFRGAVLRADVRLGQRRGADPMAGPADFLRRSLKRLLVGLEVRDRCRERWGVAPERILVFDTPEHAPAARLLAEAAGKDPRLFALPSSGLRDREARLGRLLGLPRSSRPLAVPDLELLRDAVGEVASMRGSGLDRGAVADRVGAETERALRRLRAPDGAGPVPVEPGSLPAWFEVAGALLDREPGHEAHRLVRLLSLVTGLARGRCAARGALADLSGPARFLATREILYGFRTRFPLRESWIRIMIDLGEDRRRRRRAGRRIEEGLLSPWSHDRAWYDPAGARA